MKHRTLVIIILILSLLMIPVHAKASTMVVDRAHSARELGSSHRFSNRLADILNTLPDGHHDNFAGTQSPFFCRAEGWAADPDDRTNPLKVRVFADGVEVAETVADTFRQDLADAGVCREGNCSFSVNLWGLIAPDVNHLISVQAQDAQTGEWGSLYDTPKTLDCFTPQTGTFLVNSTADDMDANTGDGLCETFNPGECTLRAAIMESNASPGSDTINFNIPGKGPFTISPTYGFDFIFDPVTIDATTQPGFSGTPFIELEGSKAGPDAYGIVIFAGSSTVRGLAINRFSLTGIDINVNGGNTIQGNYIGTDLSGTVALGNGVNGVAVSQGSGNNLIGGTAFGNANLISGNGGAGIVIVDAGSSNNVIQGNLIGTDVTGSVDLGNGSGISIGSGASDNMIGGKEATARNIISGNECPGIAINSAGSTRNLVAANYIGTDKTGTQALGNGCEGIYIGSGATDNSVGGNISGAGNLISGNIGNGVSIDIGAGENLLQGNYIGTDVTGTLNLGNSDDGVLLLAANNTVGGTTPEARNIISGNQEQGIRIAGSEATGNKVQGNFIGTDITGSVALSNGTDCCHSGVVIHAGASHNTIGGTAPGAGNVISGNTADGVSIFDVGTAGNLIQGNYIGTDNTGTIDLGNRVNGIAIAGGPDSNLIGGTTAGAGNLISGNGDTGIVIIDAGTAGNVVQGNFIGTDVNGTTVLANDGKGVAIYTGAANNLIGGTSSLARNLISGNGDNGVVIYGEGASSNTMQGNYIGTDVSGTLALGNTGYGIFIGSAASNNMIGGLAAVAGNLISGNSEHGIGIFDDGTTGNMVQGNRIGTDASGTLPLGNSRSGIALGDALNNTVGGTAANAGNIIAFNHESGVVLYNASGNAIFSNSIHSNMGLGIELGDDGVTLNDLFDVDSGPNNQQNFPLLNPVKTTAKGILIQGALLSTRNTTFRLEFFSNNACDPSGYGEGQTYLGSVNVKTNSTGHINFKITLPTPLPSGRYVTATATDPANNTSEFSQCVVVSP